MRAMIIPICSHNDACMLFPVIMIASGYYYEKVCSPLAAWQMWLQKGSIDDRPVFCSYYYLRNNNNNACFLGSFVCDVCTKWFNKQFSQCWVHIYWNACAGMLVHIFSWVDCVCSFSVWKQSVKKWCKRKLRCRGTT